MDCIGDCDHNDTILMSFLVFVSILVHAAICRAPLVDNNVKLNYISVLTLTCENEIPNINASTTDKQHLNITCHSNGNGFPIQMILLNLVHYLPLHHQVFSTQE